MATVWQVENNTSTGITFGASGFMGQLKAWVTRAPHATPIAGTQGGAGWFIVDDQSGATDPYIVVSDVNGTTVNAMNNAPNGLPQKYIKIGYLASRTTVVSVQSYLWWDATTHTGHGLWHGSMIPVQSTTNFSSTFKGGTSGLVLGAKKTTDWYIAGVLDWTGDTTRVEGTDKYGVLQNGVIAGSSVTLTLAGGQASNFTEGKKYFIFDMNGHTWANYVTVTNINAGSNQITVDAVTYNFPTGAVIASYAHRHVGIASDFYMSDQYEGMNPNFNGYGHTIPYMSHDVQENVMHDQTDDDIYSSVTLDIMRYLLSRENPNDYGIQSVQKPFIVEFYENNVYDGEQLNRGYGQVENMLIGYDRSYEANVGGVTAQGKEYVWLPVLDENQDLSDRTFFLNTNSAV